MTCKDCKYYTDRPKKDWYTFNDLGFCDMALDERIVVNENCPVNKWCDNKFEPTHECVGNALDALDSWESISK